MIMRLKESRCHVWPGRFGTYRIAWKGWYYPTPAWYALGAIAQRPRDTLKGREIISPFLTPWWVWYQYRTVWVWSLILFAPLHIPNLNSVHVGVASSMMWWDIFIAKTANSEQHPYQHHYLEACPNVRICNMLPLFQLTYDHKRVPTSCQYLVWYSEFSVYLVHVEQSLLRGCMLYFITSATFTIFIFVTFLYVPPPSAFIIHLRFRLLAWSY